MNIYPPKNLGKTIEVKASNRPIKIAYIVPYEESSANHLRYADNLLLRLEFR